MKALKNILVPLVIALPGVALSHELWLEPEKYQLPVGESVAIDIMNGQDFNGLDLSWFDKRVDHASVILNGEAREYKGLPGDLPAISLALDEGLHIVTYASTLSKLTYDSWEKTLSFATHKDATWFEKAHADRGLPQEGVTEGYWRYSKTLVAGGDGQGLDVDTGMETEFIALTNPYHLDGQPMRVLLMYQGAPRGDAQVEMWAKSGDDVTRTFHRTDAEGIAELPVTPGFSYQIDAVVIREPASTDAIALGVMWESLWANMTFAVPQ